MLTKDHAEAIARKLKAVMISGRKHDIAAIRYNGQSVAQFGIRRGSRRDQGHDYIPSQIHVTRQQAVLLAQCRMSFERWVAVMKEKGHIKT
jgi:hypothetical protein